MGRNHRLGELVCTHGTHVLSGVSDADELTEIAERSTRPHRVIPRSATGALDASLYTLAFGDLVVSKLTYGAEVLVVPGDRDPDTFLFPVLIEGRAMLHYGRARSWSTRTA